MVTMVKVCRLFILNGKQFNIYIYSDKWTEQGEISHINVGFFLLLLTCFYNPLFLSLVLLSSSPLLKRKVRVIFASEKKNDKVKIAGYLSVNPDFSWMWKALRILYTFWFISRGMLFQTVIICYRFYYLTPINIITKQQTKSLELNQNNSAYGCNGIKIQIFRRRYNL